MTSQSKELAFPIQTLNRENDKTFTRITKNISKIIHCPTGTKFSPSEMICVFQDSFETDPSSTNKLTDCEQSQTGATQPNPDNCRSFILCGPSGAYEMDCPGNLIFNKDLGVCDFPQTHCCCEYKEKRPSILTNYM